MTFNELSNRAKSKGNNLADVAIGRMMELVEEETGRFPSWTDIAPDWVVRNLCGKSF